MNSLAMPILSIVMPAYNAEKYLDEAIKSFIAQSFRDWKLIIIDDCSHDKTWQIINDWEAKDHRIVGVKNTENLKVARTVNKGIAMIDSPYFARVDSDDVLLPHHFEKLISFLQQNKAIGLCGSQVITIDSQSQFRRKWNYEVDKDWISISSIFACPFLQSSVVMRTEVIKSVNGYDPEMELIEDYELWIRILQKYQAESINDYTIKYRIHGNNMSETNKSVMLKILERMYHANCDFFPIDLENLSLHAKMEIGEWGQFPVNEFKQLKKWKQKLMQINKSKHFYNQSDYKNVVNKYFTNTLLKIASQNGGVVKMLALSKAYLFNTKWAIFITKRKIENSKE